MKKFFQGGWGSAQCMLTITVHEELMYIKNTMVQGSPWWLNGGQWWPMQETRVWSWVWEDPICLGGEGNGTPRQYSCLENRIDGGAWWAAVHGVVKSRTWLSDFTFTFHFDALEKEMATHSSVLAWRIPGKWGRLVGCRLWGHTELDMTEST